MKWSGLGGSDPIQGLIDSMISHMTSKIDDFNDKAINDEIPDKVEKIQKEIDDAEAEL